MGSSGINLSDCFLMSAMATIAQQNPDLIKKMIRLLPVDARPNKFGARSYEVDLHFKGKMTTITVNDRFPPFKFGGNSITFQGQIVSLDEERKAHELHDETGQREILVKLERRLCEKDLEVLEYDQTGCKVSKIIESLSLSGLKVGDVITSIGEVSLLHMAPEEQREALLKDGVQLVVKRDLLQEAKWHLERARRARADGVGGLDDVDCKHFWFAIVEKAFAKHYGGYEALEFGYSVVGMNAITGTSQLTMGDARVEEISLEAIHNCLTKKRFLTANKRHSWAICAVNLEKEMIDVFEPTNLSIYPKPGRITNGGMGLDKYKVPGQSGLFRLPWDKFKEFFRSHNGKGSIDIGSTGRRRLFISYASTGRE